MDGFRLVTGPYCSPVLHCICSSSQSVNRKYSLKRTEHFVDVMWFYELIKLACSAAKQRNFQKNAVFFFLQIPSRL